jgi:organic hydroperoxide reductase OsmC/OhrA
MTTGHQVRVSWSGGKDDLRAHEVEFADNRLKVQGSCAEALGGDPTKADPEELFVAALSACHMLWFLDFARRRHLRVIAYVDEPLGTMDDERFLDVELRPGIEFEGEIPLELVAELHECAHAACFIANSVSCAVRVNDAR